MHDNGARHAGRRETVRKITSEITARPRLRLVTPHVHPVGVTVRRAVLRAFEVRGEIIRRPLNHHNKI